MVRKQTILVTGSTGQLGQELAYLAKNCKRYKFIFKNRKEFDLSSDQSIKSNLRKLEYDYFINAGAYTAVDKAESESKKAYKVNAAALTSIAKHTHPLAKIIHISSDYVYHHNPSRPLEESDKTLPKGVYAKSKLEGEKNLLKGRPDSIVIRTSWVYSSYGNNFVKTMLKLGKERDSLSVVADQFGTPTYARDIARTIMKIVRNFNTELYNGLPEPGVYNYTNTGLTNWHEFANKIFEYSKIDCQVSKTTTKAYNAPAPRPAWSMLSKEKIQSAFGVRITPWEKSLQECLSELGYN